MGNDEELIKTKSLADVEKEFHSFDGARVSGEERNDDVSGGGGGGDDIDVNMPLKELLNRRNIGERKLGSEEDFLDDSEIEKPPKEGGYGNGEIGQTGGVNGDDSLTQKVEYGGGDGINGNSVVVGDHGSEGKSLMSLGQRGRRSKIKGGGTSNSDVKGDPDMKTTDFSSGVSQRTRNRVVRGKKEDVEDMDVASNANELDFEGDQEIGFSVGDFVWGKIKSHPCWPGRIYSPSYASEFALNYKHEGRLLVAYFGDGTFAWCDPSQLKPFVDHFEEMSKQSSLKSFVHAVDEAVDEFGRVVELKMTSLYAMKGSHSSIPMVVNGGIKEGVHLPLDGVEKFSVYQFEPTVMLADIRSLARGTSMANMLELRVLRSQLSCFYHAKGGYLLPVYYEPMGIKDIVQKESSPRGPDDGDWFLSPGVSSRKRRKEKSMAELLGTETKALEGNHVGSSKGEMQLRSGKKRRMITDEDQRARNKGDDDVSGKKRQTIADKDQRGRNKGDDDETNINQSGKLASKGGRRTRKDQGAKTEGDDDEADISRSGKLASKAGRRTRKIADENQGHVTENSMMTRLSARKKEKLPRERKMGMSLRVESGVTSEEGQERMASPRERKKSKYLSPPYTTLLQKQSSSSSLMGSEPGGSLELSDVARMGERITRASGKLVGSGSPSLVKCMKVDDESMKSMSSSNKVLCEIRSAALDSICSRKDKSFDTIKGFLSSYRNASYKNGPNYHIYKNFMADKKRKRTVSDTKQDTALVMKFPPEFTLPSKDDLMKMNSKFGPLDELKSKVVPKSSTAKIVFLKSLDAEAAMDNMKQSSPFGTAKVSYRIRQLDASEKNKKKGKLSETKESKSMNKNPSGVSENEPLAVIFIKQKLEAMTSMLSQTDGKMTEEVKTNLENEVKELLKKVKLMTAASSSSQ